MIGLSILSGAHMHICPRVMELLKEKGLDDVQVVIGGIIPDVDIPKLNAMGITRHFPARHADAAHHRLHHRQRPRPGVTSCVREMLLAPIPTGSPAMRTLLLADDNVTVQRVIALTFAAGADAGRDRRATASRPWTGWWSSGPTSCSSEPRCPTSTATSWHGSSRSKPESKDVPVLLLSGAFESVDEAQLLSSGANGVIEKPVEPTAIIKRVKELLGLSTEPAPAMGRLVTAATATVGQRPMQSPTMPRAVTTSRPMPPAWEPPRDPTPDMSAGSLEDTAGRDDYLESLGDAFDTLDQQLAGRQANTQQRDPSPPPGQRNQPDAPRSPGRMPTAQAGAPRRSPCTK